MCTPPEIEAPSEPLLNRPSSAFPVKDGVGHIIMSFKHSLSINACFGNRHYVSSEEIRVFFVGLQLSDSAMRLSTHGAQEKHCKCRVKSEK